MIILIRYSISMVPLNKYKKRDRYFLPARNFFFYCHTDTSKQNSDEMLNLPEHVPRFSSPAMKIPHNAILKWNSAGKSQEGEAEMRRGDKTVENSAFLP